VETIFTTKVFKNDSLGSLGLFHYFYSQSIISGDPKSYLPINQFQLLFLKDLKSEKREENSLLIVSKLIKPIVRF
jgi:hypothetical protein